MEILGNIGQDCESARSFAERTATMNRKNLPILCSLVLASLLAVSVTLSAQTFTVLHTFGGEDGIFPYAGLTLAGTSLYGTTAKGGSQNFGVVFQLQKRGSNWLYNKLYNFDDGNVPYAGVTVGPNGSLYGTTYQGGNSCSQDDFGCGVVYNLKPPTKACLSALCPWVETTLYHFAGGNVDGSNPGYGNLVFDKAGNLYGTTTVGGAYNQGTVFKLAPSGGGWKESVIYNFTGGTDGAQPWSGVVLDAAGNLYGTTRYGGGSNSCGTTGCGTAYELTPSGSGWTESVLYAFQGTAYDGAYPFAGLVFDQSGNLYGATSGRGSTIFQLSQANGAWTFNLLYILDAETGPEDSLAIDGSGNLYGAIPNLHGDSGKIFELNPGSGGWTFTVVYAFRSTGDGETPIGTPVLDASGNIYGTASDIGSGDYGTVWEITP